VGCIFLPIKSGTCFFILWVGFGISDDYQPILSSFVDFIQDSIGDELEQIGLLKFPFFEKSVVTEPNGNLKSATGVYHSFGGIVARTDNKCGHVNCKGLARWNQDNSININFWTVHQQFRNYYGGATHPLLDLGLKVNS
jgi:hypothetical protein